MSKEELLTQLHKWMDEITVTADNVPNWRAVKSALATIILLLEQDLAKLHDLRIAYEKVKQYDEEAKKEQLDPDGAYAYWRKSVMSYVGCP